MEFHWTDGPQDSRLLRDENGALLAVAFSEIDDRDGEPYLSVSLNRTSRKPPLRHDVIASAYADWRKRCKTGNGMDIDMTNAAHRLCIDFDAADKRSRALARFDGSPSPSEHAETLRRLVEGGVLGQGQLYLCAEHQQPRTVCGCPIAGVLP